MKTTVIMLRKIVRRRENNCSCDEKMIVIVFRLFRKAGNPFIEMSVAKSLRKFGVTTIIILKVRKNMFIHEIGKCVFTRGGIPRRQIMYGAPPV